MKTPGRGKSNDFLALKCFNHRRFIMIRYPSIGIVIGSTLFCSFILLSACAHRSYLAEPPDRETDLFSLSVALYQGPLNHLSAVRSSDCPMYPSDSAYSRQAVQKHGPIIGWVMAMDRWMRCGRDETRLSPPILVNGHWKTFDPLTFNDFWWSPP